MAPRVSVAALVFIFVVSLSPLLASAAGASCAGLAQSRQVVPQAAPRRLTLRTPSTRP